MKRARTRLLLGAALCALPAPAFGADQETPQSVGRDEIIVYGERLPPLFAGILPQAELSEADIAAYGFDTVGELIEQIQAESSVDGEGPVILINGRPAVGIREVSDLPTEAVAGIQVFAGDAASRIAQRSTRRVVNVVIKSDHRQLTLNGEAGLATAGEAFQGQSGLNLLKLKGGERRSVAFTAKRSDRLLESDRDIQTDASGVAFAR
jgi:hypothetical protein